MKLFLTLIAACSLGCATLDQPTQCPVHNQPLREQLVAPRTGSPRLEYEKARKSNFPFSGTLFTGQLPPSNTQILDRTPVCPACSVAERDWLRANFW